jgi:hypothetical protein
MGTVSRFRQRASITDTCRTDHMERRRPMTFSRSTIGRPIFTTVLRPSHVANTPIGRAARSSARAEKRRRRLRDRRLEISNSRPGALGTASPYQSRMFKDPQPASERSNFILEFGVLSVCWCLVFGVWCFSGAWALVLGVFTGGVR